MSVYTTYWTRKNYVLSTYIYIYIFFIFYFFYFLFLIENKHILGSKFSDASLKSSPPVSCRAFNGCKAEEDEVASCCRCCNCNCCTRCNSSCFLTLFCVV